MPMKRELYPDNWDEIARAVKEEAGWRCQRCWRAHDKSRPDAILTVHHLDRNPSNCKKDNLIALCARCHLQDEARLRAAERAAGIAEQMKCQIGLGI